MSRIKTLAATGAFLLSLYTPLHASADLGRLFASCAGRFSAELEHAWLVGSPDADHLHHIRVTFVSLIDASVAPDQRRAALNYRIETKLAHAALLTAASFSDNDESAARARLIADRHLTSCKTMLLDS